MVALTVVEYVPAGHSRQRVDPAIKLYDPTGHEMHLNGESKAATVEYVPAKHVWHVEDALARRAVE